MVKSNEKVEFGDFQTPIQLAKDVILNIFAKNGYKSIIEPTCGIGGFLQACIEIGIDPKIIEGWEINPNYVKVANDLLQSISGSNKEFVHIQDFFEIDWEAVRKKHKESVLFVGNPPWVTNAELGKLLSKNLPKKSNFQNLSGLEAITGKSNFDISEWMLIKILDFISSTKSSLAFLIKTSVARKLFQHISKNKLEIANISITQIDAKKHFDVSVDACLFVAKGFESVPERYVCDIYSGLEESMHQRTMGIIENKLISNIVAYESLSQLDKGSEFKWRSGVKHDASKIMELHCKDGKLTNGFSEEVDIPMDYLYPMYKSSHIAKNQIKQPEKCMLVTQIKIGEKTEHIKRDSPKTWEYLLNHADKLDNRKSSIYRNAPRFAIFGIGDYTFSPWKIVISGLYKNMIFSKIGSIDGKPIVVDDTCYMLGFEEENQADFVLEMLTSDICKEFIKSIVFLDNKRPITVALLNRINIQSVAIELGLEKQYQKLFKIDEPQMSLF